MSISGNLRTMPFPDLLQWVSQSQKTGTLVVEGPRFTKKVHFQDGLIVAVASENPREFLGYYLVGWGLISEEELEQLLEMQQRHGTLLGELLVIVGRLDRSQLDEVLRRKTTESLFEMFLWTEGGFRFLENVLPSFKLQPLALRVDGLVMEGVRRLDEWARIRPVVPGVEWVPRIAGHVPAEILAGRRGAMIAAMDGRRSVEMVALASRSGTFDVLELVFEGVRGGFLVVRPPDGGEPGPIPGLSRGSWRLLLRDAERALKEGELLEAYRRVHELQGKYQSQREVMERSGGITRRIEQQLEATMPPGDAVLALALAPAELTRLSCRPAEAFLLTRVNGVYTVNQILAVLPGDALANRLMIDHFVRAGVVRVHGSRESG